MRALVYPSRMNVRTDDLARPAWLAGLASALALLLLLTGCGQKGPLYLPERTPMEVGEADDPAEAAAEDEEDRSP